MMLVYAVNEQFWLELCSIGRVRSIRIIENKLRFICAFCQKICVALDKVLFDICANMSGRHKDISI